jgi:hypothetical protein
MTTPTIKGDTTITWGTDSQYSIGYVQRVRDLSTGAEAEIEDGDGEAVALVLYNARHEMEADIIIKTGDTLPARGDDITIAGEAGICLEVERTWENKGVLKGSIKAKKYAFNS